VQKLTFKLLGSSQISLDGRLLTQFVSRKAQALLIYVAVTGKPCARELLANLFWHNLSPGQALKNLRTVLPNLRQLVGSHLIITRQTVEFNRECDYSLDTEAIRAIQDYTTDDVQWLSEAISQYQGDFLEGFCVPGAPDFESWTLMEREHFRELAIQGLHILATQYLVQQKYTTGLTVTRKLLQLDPWRETAHQQQMMFLAHTNQRRAALAQYEICRQMLADEFSAQPMATTTALYEQIRAGTLRQFAEVSINSPVEHRAVPAVVLAAPIQQNDLTQLSSCCDWGEAVDVSIFYGREAELATLQHSILHQHCRLLLLAGMGGIGKTALAAKLAQTIQAEFDFVIWRSLRNAPTLELLLADLVPFLSHQQDSQNTPDRLIYWLRQHRCLVILDNFETILQSEDRAGQYRPGYTNYSPLLSALAEVQHQSCIIMTSREKLAEIVMMQGSPAIQIMPLTGSSTAALALLTARGLRGSVVQKQQLAEQYSCNPLALKIVASLIHDLFDGSIELFLQQGTILFNGIRRLFEQQFERLSSLEQDVLYWLAINREWTTVAELAADLPPAVTRSQLLEALESLSWRNLIEHRQGAYTQQPLMMEYVTNALVKTITNELIEKKIHRFNEYALLKLNLQEYIHETQRRLILAEVATQFQAALHTPERVETQLRDILGLLRRHFAPSGYAAGNLINLCGHLGVNLTGYDFSNLYICHADLRQQWLQAVNFQNSQFANSLFTQPIKAAFTLSFNLAGTLLVSGDNAGNLTVRRVSDDQLISSWQGHCTTIWTAVWSADGRLATGSNDGTIRVWNPLTGDCLQTIQATSVVWMVAWSPDGQTLVSAGSEDALRFWDVRTGRCISMLETQHHWSKTVVWSPDGAWVASGGRDGTLKLWCPETGKLMQTCEGHHQEVWHLAWSPGDRPLLASSSADQTVRIWNPETGQCLHVLQGHSRTVLRVAWNNDGKLLASSSDDTTVRLWGIETEQCLRILQGHQNSIWSLAWSPVESLLVSGSADHTTRLWDMHTGDCLKILQGYSASVRGLAWHKDSKTLATGSDDHRIRLWNTATGNCLSKFHGQTNYIWSLAWSPDYQLIASSSDNAIIELWNPHTGHCVRTLQGHSSWVWSVVWSADGTQLFSGSNDQSIRVWDRETGHCVKCFNCESWVTTLALSPDGKILAAGGTDCQIQMIDSERGERICTVSGHTAWIWSVAWSPDGTMLATGSEDGTVRLWQADSGRCLHLLQASETRIFSVAWSPDSKQVACGGSDGIVKIWQAKTGRCLQQLVGHQGSLWGVAWQPSGALLASSGDDLTRIWDVKTGDCLKALNADRPYEGMNIAGVTGLTSAQKLALKVLGASE
jgi:WD40 repeat protein/DNA-binding SARP family transcriptional activator